MKKQTFILFCLFSFHPLFANSLMEVGSKAMAEGNFKKAEFLFKQAKEQGANPVFVDYNLAYLYYCKNEISLSIKYYKNVIKAAPLFKDAYHNLSRVYFSLNEIPKSIEAMEQLISVNSNNLDSYLLLGDLYIENDMYLAAEKQYLKAIAMNPSDEESYIAYSDLYGKLNNTEMQLDILQNALLEITNARLIYEREAYIYLKRKEYLQAASVFDRMIENSGDIEENEEKRLTMQLVNAYVDGKYNLLALEVLQKLHTKYPLYKECNELIAYVLFSDENFGKAFEFYQNLYQIDDKKAKIAGYLGLREVMTRAYNRNLNDLLQKMILFYKLNNLSDELYKKIKQELG